MVPRALSEDGRVVVGMVPVLPEQDGRAFFWTDSSGVVEIEPVRPGLPSSAVAVSADGKSIIGQEGYSDRQYCKPNALDYDPTKARLPFIMDESGVRLLQPGTPWCYDVWDASSDGSVIVGVFEDTTSGLRVQPMRAFRWEGTFVDLHDEQYGATLARGVSGDGNIVVGNALSFGEPTTAVLYDGGAQSLFEGIAFDGNRDGSVIVGSRLNGPTIRLAGGQETSLGTGSGDAFISDDGGVIIFNTSQAMIWTEASGKTESLLNYVRQRGSVSSHWTLRGATAVSGDGRYVAGWDVIDGSIHGWRVSIAKELVIEDPKAGKLFVAGTKDTISWKSTGVEKIDIYLSTDRNLNLLQSIDTGFPADSGMYVWEVPDSLSRHATIVIEDASDPTIADTSAFFRIKGYVLTRVDADGEYEAFQPDKHGWSFPNAFGMLDPASYQNTNQFEYIGTPQPGTDPFTSLAYDQVEFGGLGVSPASFPDYPSTVRAFGTGQFFVGPPYLGIYRPVGLSDWANRVASASWGGSCSGMSISAIMAFVEKDRFGAAFPAIGVVDELNSVVPAIPVVDPVREVINTLFVHWHGAEAINHAIAHASDSPRETLQQLKDALLDADETAGSIGYIYINNASGLPSSAHAVAPIRLTRTSVNPNRWDLTIYDPNAANVERTIQIDSTANSWAYGSGYNGTGAFFLMDPHANYYDFAVSPGNTPVAHSLPAGKNDNKSGMVEVFAPAFASVTISGQGGTIGFADSLTFGTLDGAVMDVVPTGYPSSPHSYRLPAGTYRAAVSDFPDTTATFATYHNGVSYAAIRTNANHADTDLFSLENGLVIRNDDPVDKAYVVRTMRAGATDAGQFVLSGLRLASDDSVGFGHQTSGILHLDNWASNKTYEALVRHSDQTGVSSSTYGPIPVASGHRHGLAPNWESLGDTLKVLVDSNIDGIWDDSIYVAGVSTAIDDGVGVTGRSLGVSLRQNFPNPFNTSTRIVYALPEPTDVRLAIYDVTGRLVTVLVEGRMQAGEHEVQFDAAALPAGVYLASLRAGATVKTALMTLMK